MGQAGRDVFTRSTRSRSVAKHDNDEGPESDICCWEEDLQSFNLLELDSELASTVATCKMALKHICFLSHRRNVVTALFFPSGKATLKVQKKKEASFIHVISKLKFPSPFLFESNVHAISDRYRSNVSKPRAQIFLGARPRPVDLARGPPSSFPWRSSRACGVFFGCRHCLRSFCLVCSQDGKSCVDGESSSSSIVESCRLGPLEGC